MTGDQLREQLQRPYDRAVWQGILQEIFGNVSILASPHEIPFDRENIKSFTELGSVRLNDGKYLSVFEIKVGRQKNILRNRVELRNLVARYIDQQTRHGVLVIFDGHTDDYRFTFAARETEFDAKGNFVEKETATKRFTYLLGPHETCTTPAQRFRNLAEKRERTELGDVIEAFSVERLNKEFFDSYRRHYQKFVDHLLSGDIPEKNFNISPLQDEKEQDRANKPVRDFAKRLLGRIVFIHFLQKKGWMGCPPERRNWLDGDRNFLFNLFSNCNEKDKFHSQCLVPLFYETLNRPERPGDLFSITSTRIPYLNGGLFERESCQVERIDFPASLFESLLDFFGQYNFTIDENDPDDHEVGIDPEMLGHIFENLLEDNKDKGAYYTPKAIVQYMCRQSLLYYLQGKLGKHEELTRLVRFKDAGERNDNDNWVRDNAGRIEELLDRVRICDPAIGSGAFPIGLLQEIYWIKLMLDWTLDPAETKLKIIQNSIYGVDIDAGAVEIARLRFWLALIVDEEQPRPLPNLDYKIMQGDSLLESFEGVPLDTLHVPQAHKVRVVEKSGQIGLFADQRPLFQYTNKKRAEEIVALIRDYFGETSPRRKQELHRRIDRFVLDHIDYNLQLAEERLETELHQYRADIADKQKRLKRWQPPKRTKKRIASIEAEIAAIQQKKVKLAELETKAERPYFLWHLFFQDVFALGGFDIVIGNPPYVRADNPDIAQERIAILNEVRNGTSFYQTLWEKWDLYIPFIERGYCILRENGLETMIVSDAYCHAKYAVKSQEWFLKNAIVRRLDFLGKLRIFDAGVRNMIFFYEQGDGLQNKPERRLHHETFRNITLLSTAPQLELNARIFFPGQTIQEQFKVNTTRLADLCYVSYGLRPSSDEKKAKGEFVTADLISEIESAIHTKPYVEGKHLTNWQAYKHLWLEWGTKRAPASFCRKTFLELYPVLEKLIAKRSPGAKPIVCYDADGLIFTPACVGFIPWHYLSGVQNRSLKKVARYRNEPQHKNLPSREKLEDLSYRFSVKYLLAVMNSTVAREFLRANRRSNIHLYPNDWKKLPIPDVPPKQQAPVVSLVDEILTAKRSDPDADITALELAVDKLVTNLYGLFEKEVVEGIS